MRSEPHAIILKCKELYRCARFGPDTVNQGAVLLDCEWDGGCFESGLFLGGIFRSGHFVTGMFLGGIFWDGTWDAGVWEGGFDRNGIYRPRGDAPVSW